MLPAVRDKCDPRARAEVVFHGSNVVSKSVHIANYVVILQVAGLMFSF